MNIREINELEAKGMDKPRYSKIVTIVKPSIGIRFKVAIVIEPDGAVYHAYCPALVGLHTWGGTEGEASNNAQDAATAYLASMIKNKDPIPVGVVI